MAHRNVQRVSEVLATIGSDSTIRELDASTRTAADAAAALGSRSGPLPTA